MNSVAFDVVTDDVLPPLLDRLSVEIKSTS